MEGILTKNKQILKVLQIKTTKLHQLNSLNPPGKTIVKTYTITGGVSTRGDHKRKPIEIGKTNLSQKTCISDAIRIWNQAPDSVTNSLTVTQAKNEIKKYVTSLPT